MGNGVATRVAVQTPTMRWSHLAWFVIQIAVIGAFLMFYVQEQDRLPMGPHVFLIIGGFAALAVTVIPIRYYDWFRSSSWATVGARAGQRAALILAIIFGLALYDPTLPAKALLILAPVLAWLTLVLWNGVRRIWLGLPDRDRPPGEGGR
jgi:hypothetical protein